MACVDDGAEECLPTLAGLSTCNVCPHQDHYGNEENPHGVLLVLIKSNLIIG